MTAELRGMTPLELAEFIQAQLDAHNAANPEPASYGGYSAWHLRNREFAEALLAELARDYGCRFKVGCGDASRMKLAGISISCTSGELAMLRGWVRKVRAADGEAANG